MKGWAAVTLLAAGLLVLAGSAAARPARRLQKGFPYAAEIQAEIQYDGTYEVNRRSFQPCSSGEEVVRVPISERHQVHIERTVFFRHITVPVATPGELGKAAAKLGLQPTVTTPGRIKNDHSSMDLEDELVVPNPESEGCHQAPVNCHWELAPLPSGAFQEIAAHDHGFLPVFWSISVLGSNTTIEEECPVTNGSSELAAQLTESGKLYPKGLENFPEVTISRPLASDFHRLQHQKSVEFQVSLDTPQSGTANCATHFSEEEETCTHGVSGTAYVKLKRLFLYKSKQSYPR
ncbi:MAG TPA: hypothetical protein VMT37_12445 [Solirubrobacterales bacterium]|nr:hypothetical protein [Solirubrobacterales bacterium]